MTRFFFFLVLLILTFDIAATEKNENFESISVGISHERAPYCFYDVDKLVGLDVELIANIFSKVQFESRYVDVTYARALKLIESEQLDCAVGGFDDTQANEYTYLSRPFRSEVIQIALRREDKGHYEINELNDLLKYDDLTIAVARGVWLGKEFSKFLKENPQVQKRIVTLPRIAQRIHLLINNRVDLLIEDKYALLYTARRLGVSDKIFLSDYVVNKANVYLLFGKKIVDREFIDELDLAIAEFWATEDYFKIFEKYK